MAQSTPKGEDLALDHYVLRFQEVGVEGAPASLVGDDMLSGKKASGSLAVKLPKSAGGRSILFAVEVVDSGGNTGRSYLGARVNEDGSVLFEPKAAPGFGDAPNLDGVDISVTPNKAGALTFGGCSAAGAGGAAGAGALGVAVALALARRRRRGRAGP